MKIKTEQVSENRFKFPHWSKVAKTYNLAVGKVLEEIGKSRPFINWIDGELGEEQLRETLRKKEMIEKVTKEGVVELEVQLGQKYKGKSVKEARELFTINEFGLGAYEVGCILLAKPDILKNNDDLWLDCPGDEYDFSDSDVRFDRAPVFRWDDGKLEFDTIWFGDACAYYGSVSAFLPQTILGTGNLETIEPLSLDSAISKVKKAGYVIYKPI